jgi:hypothetical protein
VLILDSYLSQADPADEASVTQTRSQAGQVWYPDSAAKTAQSIRDLNHEGLPLVILANWRGFSGEASTNSTHAHRAGSIELTLALTQAARAICWTRCSSSAPPSSMSCVRYVRCDEPQGAAGSCAPELHGAAGGESTEWVSQVSSPEVPWGAGELWGSFWRLLGSLDAVGWVNRSIGNRCSCTCPRARSYVAAHGWCWTPPSTRAASRCTRTPPHARYVHRKSLGET